MNGIEQFEGRIFITGSYIDTSTNESNILYLTEIDNQLNNIWTKQIQFEDSITQVGGSEFAINNNYIFIGGQVNRGLTEYACLMKFDVMGDSLGVCAFLPHSRIDDVIFNYDNQSLTIAGYRINQSYGAQIIEMGIDFDEISWHYIESNGYRDQYYVSLKKESDSTTIMACQDSERSIYGLAMGYETELRFDRLDSDFQLIEETVGIPNIENRDHPAVSNCMDFNTSDTIYFCSYEYNYVPCPPTSPSELWLGYLDRSFNTHQIFKIWDDDYFYRPCDITSLTHGGCVVVGNSWNLSNEPSTVQGLIVELSPEDIISTDYRTLFQSEEIVPIPNPVDQNFQFRNPEGKLIDILIYNSSGKVVCQIQSNDTYVYVSSGAWESGVYIYRVINENDLIGSGKIVKM
jgi:hypothetical protein